MTGMIDASTIAHVASVIAAPKTVFANCVVEFAIFHMEIFVSSLRNPFGKTRHKIWLQIFVRIKYVNGI